MFFAEVASKPDPHPLFLVVIPTEAEESRRFQHHGDLSTALKMTAQKVSVGQRGR